MARCPLSPAAVKADFILTAPGLATPDPDLTVGLALLLSTLDELTVLADLLEKEAAGSGQDYLSGALSPEVGSALSDAIDALVALLFSSVEVGSSGFGGSWRSRDGSGDVTVSDVVAAAFGVSDSLMASSARVVAQDFSPLVGDSFLELYQGDHRLAAGSFWEVDGECEGTEADSGRGSGLSWLPYLAGSLDRRDDGLCITDVQPEAGGFRVVANNDSFWVGVAGPVHVQVDGSIGSYAEEDADFVSARSYNIPPNLVDSAVKVVWTTGGWVLDKTTPLSSMMNGFCAYFSFGLRKCDDDWVPDESLLEQLSDSLEIVQDSVVSFRINRSVEDHSTVYFAVARPFSAGGSDGEQDYEAAGNTPQNVVRRASLYQVMHFFEPALLMVIDKGVEKLFESLGDELEAATDTAKATDLSQLLTLLYLQETASQRAYFPKLTSEHLIGIALSTVLGHLTDSLILAVPGIGPVLKAWSYAAPFANTAIRYLGAYLSANTNTAVSFYTTSTPTSPIPAAEPSFLAAGTHHSCWIRADNTIACAGDNDDGQTDVPDGGPFTSVAAGRAHTCALRDNGTISCWGNSRRGQHVPKNTGPFIAVTAGRNFTCGLRDIGSVECWGNNDSKEPITVEPANGPYVSVTAGGYHACALDTDGNVECWGNNENGQATLPDDGRFRAIAAGRNHTCALRHSNNPELDRTATCWGNNPEGRATPPAGDSNSPQYDAITAGGKHSCGLQKRSNIIRCWGQQRPRPSTRNQKGRICRHSGWQHLHVCSTARSHHQLLG